MTALPSAADDYLGRSHMVIPDLPGGPDLLGHDDRQYGQTVTWWWADDRRLVLPVDTGVLVATDPARVDHRPLRLHDCARLLLVDAGSGGTHVVRETHGATVVLTRSRGHGLLAGSQAPDPGAVPPAVAARLGTRVHVTAGEDVAAATGELVWAAMAESHLVLVLAPRLVVVLRRPVAATDGDGGSVRLEGADRRVTWAPDDQRATAVRPATLLVEAAR